MTETELTMPMFSQQGRPCEDWREDIPKKYQRHSKRSWDFWICDCWMFCQKWKWTYDCAPGSGIICSWVTKGVRIISPQIIRTSEGYKGSFIDHFHDEMMVMWSLIWRTTRQVGRRPNLLRRFMSITAQIKTFQIMTLFSLAIDRIRSRHWQMLFVSLTRLTRTSPLHRKSYSDGTLDWDILGSNMYNG